MSSLSHFLFQYNYLSQATGVLYVVGPNVQVSLHNCELTNNVVQDASVAQFLRKANFSLSNRYMSGNTALGSLAFAQNSYVVLQHCSVRDSRDILRLEHSTVQVLFSTFSQVETTVGAFSLIGSTLTLQNVFFNAVQGAGNCLLSGLSTSEVYMTKVHATELTCREEVVKVANSLLSLQSTTLSSVSSKSAVFNSVQSNVSLNNVHLTLSSSQVLSAQSSSLRVSNCSFTSIRTLQQVGVFSCLYCALLSIQHTTIKQVLAKVVEAV